MPTTPTVLLEQPMEHFFTVVLISSLSCLCLEPHFVEHQSYLVDFCALLFQPPLPVVEKVRRWVLWFLRLFHTALIFLPLSELSSLLSFQVFSVSLYQFYHLVDRHPMALLPHHLLMYKTSLVIFWAWSWYDQTLLHTNRDKLILEWYLQNPPPPQNPLPAFPPPSFVWQGGVALDLHRHHFLL